VQAVSLVIVAQDEERTIGRVIEAARPIAAEIVLVDSGSSDRTIAIAESFGARCMHKDWLGFARQKNFAIEQATHPWVLSLDADEILTAPLVEELIALLNSPGLGDFDGYKIPRTLFIGDRGIAHGGFYPDAQLRLFKKNKGRFGDRLVHEAIKLDGPVRQLTHSMDHYAYRDIAAFDAAMDKYARLSAQEYYNRGKSYYQKKLNPLNAALHPQWTFFNRYILRGGFIDGKDGLELATIYSGYVGKKIRYLKELVAAQTASRED
jgi:glycosyltransferase involved in cell wall biosynthesis